MSADAGVMLNPWIQHEYNVKRRNTTAGGIYMLTKDQFKIRLSSDLVKSVNKNSNGVYYKS